MLDNLLDNERRLRYQKRIISEKVILSVPDLELVPTQRYAVLHIWQLSPNVICHVSS